MSILFTLTALSAPGEVYGTKDGGGGGNAMVCRNNKKEIISAELLDLYNGRKGLFTKEKLSYAIAKKDDSIEDNLRKALKKFEGVFSLPVFNNNLFSKPWWYFVGDSSSVYNVPSVMDYWKNFDSYFEFLDDHTDLSRLDDGGHEIIQPKNKGCKKERLAYYIDNIDKIFLVREIWEKMDAFNKAALIFHEASYYYDRVKYKAVNSAKTQKLVARVFANESIPALAEGLIGRKIICAPIISSKNEFNYEYVYSQDSSGNHHFNFMYFKNEPLYSKTNLFLKNNSTNYYSGKLEVDTSDIKLPDMRVGIVRDRVNSRGLGIHFNDGKDIIPLTDEEGNLNCLGPNETIPKKINLYNELCSPSRGQNNLRCL